MLDEQKKTKAQIKKEIIEFLEDSCGLIDEKKGKYRCGTIHRNCLVLATSYKDVPRATPLEFFNEGLTLYVFGEGGGKIANIKRNAKVSAAIYEQPMKHTVVQKSLQVFGKAEIINMHSNVRLYKTKAKKWNMYTVAEKLGSPMFQDKEMSEKDKLTLIEKILSSLNLIKIVPDKIIIREYHPDFSMPKNVWKK
jgi:nitroimidazol reductase NimA-like FMN-containing flavoprotein (pyridoxamine 5'-phosphate oxidase superfamily)